MILNKKIALLDIKEALQDARFRQKLPAEMTKRVNDFLNNPGCACNISLYKDILKNHKSLLLEFFPGAEIIEETKENLAKNRWKVINCTINELESKLKEIAANGRYQIAVTRWQDQITLVANELGYF